MRAMRMVGLTYEEIAAFFNVTRMRVCAILKSAMQAAEIDRRRDITPEQKIKKMYATGVTYKDIAELYNVTLNRVPRRRGTVGSNAKPPAATRGCSGRLRMRVPSRLVRGTAIALTRIIIPFSATAVNPRQHRPDLHPNPDGGLS
jgi:DNA-binding CsgD family transcriptional regulator